MKSRLTPVLRGAALLALSLSPIVSCLRAPPIDCTDAKQEVNGLVSCGDIKMRDQDLACSSDGPGNFIGCTGGDCLSDLDCPGAKARCDYAGGGFCACNTGCLTDADCLEGQTCLCGSNGGRCIYAGCRTSADCESGQHCILYDEPEACDTKVHPSFACTHGSDECHQTADCPEGGMCFIKWGGFVCSDNGCMY